MNATPLRESLALLRAVRITIVVALSAIFFPCLPE